MNKYPFRVPAKMPYTRSSIEFNNEKIRTVACLNCKYQMRCNMPGPICGVCNREMIGVIR